MTSRGKCYGTSVPADGRCLAPSPTEFVPEVDKGTSGGAKGWIDRYAAAGGEAWFKLDSAQRSFETHLASLEVDIDPTAVAAVRAHDEDAVRLMTSFVKALEVADWAVPNTLHHTRIWQDVVSARPRPTAYIFVDAMRYEMVAELAERISGANEVQLRPALAALPSITPIWHGGPAPRLGRKLPLSAMAHGSDPASMAYSCRTERRDRSSLREGPRCRLAQSGRCDLSQRQAASKVDRRGTADRHPFDRHRRGRGVPITTAAARRIMSHVIGDLARCLRNLAAAGVEDVVVTSDHGHLFFAGDRPASMRIEAPGEVTSPTCTVACPIGKVAPLRAGRCGSARRQVGYNTDLEFVFPVSTAVFKAGGRLSVPSRRPISAGDGRAGPDGEGAPAVGS